MSSAICFNLDQSKNLSSSNGKTSRSKVSILQSQLLTLSQTTNLDWTKLKAFADNKLILVANFVYQVSHEERWSFLYEENLTIAKSVTRSQTSPCFCGPAVHIFRKHSGKRRNCS